MNVLRRQQRHGADTENQRTSECDRAHSLPKLVDRGLDKIPVEFLAMHGSLRISKAEMLTQSQFPHALCSNSRKHSTRGEALPDRYSTGLESVLFMQGGVTHAKVFFKPYRLG